jgi:hypothetical protein
MGEFLQQLWQLIWGALTLNPDAFATLNEVPRAGLMALIVLALATLSETIGQSVVLFLNRVPPLRFIISLILSVVLTIASVFVWSVVTWGVARVLFDIQSLIIPFLVVVALGHAPLIFGFFELIPYAGMFIRLILRIWALLAVTVALSNAAIPLWQVLIAAIGGWVIVEIIYRLLGKPLMVIGNWLWYTATGRRKIATLPALIEEINQ